MGDSATGRKPKLHYDVCDGARHVAEVDLSWPELRLCVQFDGWNYHCTREAFVKDRAQDRELFQLGWTVLRYPWDEVVNEPDSFIEGLVRSFELQAGSRRIGRARPKASRDPITSGESPAPQGAHT